MSCIPKILEIKGDKEILKVPNYYGLLVEGGGHYKDYDYLITFNDIGFRCGYVAIPEDHPAYGDKSDYPDYSIHGGITFFGERHGLVDEFIKTPCKDKWIGFDCGHGGSDAIDVESYKKYFDIESYKKAEKFLSYMRYGEVRKYPYVESQCKFLIDQLIEIAA